MSTHVDKGTILLLAGNSLSQLRHRSVTYLIYYGNVLPIHVKCMPFELIVTPNSHVLSLCVLGLTVHQWLNK